MKKRIYLSPPHMSGNEIKHVNQAFDENWIAPLGPNVDAFEQSVSEYCGVTGSVALSSGTAALHLALILLGVQQGDDVFVSSFTFSASVNPVVYQGATPVLIDSEPDTWNMDPQLLEQAILDRQKYGNKPKAIIVVHLYGMPAKMDEILAIAEKYSIPVIEDAAEALGSKYKGKPLGSLGKLAILSFNGNKILTTSGGGVLLSNNTEWIDEARFLATQARDQAVHYQHSKVGYNYRMSNVLAGIGRGQLEVIDERVRRKREINLYYKDKLGEFDGIEFLEEPDESYFSNCWLTTILVDPVKTGTSWQQLRLELEKENIESRPLWKPMHLQPVFEAYPAYQNNVSESLFATGMCLPSGTNMSDGELEKIVSILKKEINK